MKLNDLRTNMHTYLSKGMTPEFTMESWILIYAALNAFIKVTNSYRNVEYPEDMDMSVGAIIGEYEKGTGDEIL